MKIYPILLNIEGKPCLVVGGGGVGERKVQDLLAAGGKVTVISREATPLLQRQAVQGLITLQQGDFRPEHLEGMVLVIAATNDQEVNEAVSAAAQARGLPVNVVDQPALCSFIVPATIRRGDLVVAIGTGGRSPALAKQLRQELEQRFGPEYGPYLELLGAIRDAVLAERRDHPENQSLFTAIVASPLLTRLLQQDQAGLHGLLAELLGPVLPAPRLQELQRQAWALCRSLAQPRPV
ncbi:MAG: precorrin-2 dehydrogenase/sirohydrochlorin ferrochelatase family protein [Desulfobacca sp.]|uniref:precorrin-2 dehydrogenase/sirohydrochlorin ferrochelatase family protein n=1 Tax=Desulfobacca sp. TaxID=2067990 RepID=UPI00404AB6C6